jgi:hypothetical protein
VIRPEVKPLLARRAGLSSGWAAVIWRRQNPANRIAAALRKATGTMVHPLEEPWISPVEQAEHRSAEQQRCGQVDAGGGIGVDAGEQADRGDQSGAAQDDVDQEYRAPAQAGDVGVDDEPGQDRAAN